MTKKKQSKVVAKQIRSAGVPFVDAHNIARKFVRMRPKQFFDWYCESKYNPKIDIDFWENVVTVNGHIINEKQGDNEKVQAAKEWFDYCQFKDRSERIDS